MREIYRWVFHFKILLPRSSSIFESNNMWQSNIMNLGFDFTVLQIYSLNAKFVKNGNV